LADGEPNFSFHKLIGRYIEEARSNYGSTNGLLASDLLLLVSSDLGSNVATNEEGGMIANVKELLDIYPKMPSENQRYLASQTLNVGYRLIEGKFLNDAKLHNSKLARRCGFGNHTEVAEPPPFVVPILGSKMIACVVEAASINHWPSNTSLDEALAKVAADEKIDPSLRAKAQDALISLAVPQASKIEPTVANLEAIVKADWPPKQKQEKAVDWARYQPNWLKGKPEQPADTPPEKRLATMCKSITIYTFPEEESHKIRDDLDVLIKLYPTLPEADQQAFCAHIMDLTEKLIWTDVHGQADTLFWEIFSSVKIGWLDNGQIGAGLLGHNTYYFQSYDLQNAKKIMIKVIAFESAGNPNFASEINRRECLAGTFIIRPELGVIKDLLLSQH
jgi:hypothetical protein